MLSDPIRITDAINNPKFHPGDEVILVEGSHKFARGKFLRLKKDVEWGAIEEPNGKITSHPVEWMRHYSGPPLLALSRVEGPAQSLLRDGHDDPAGAVVPISEVRR